MIEYIKTAILSVLVVTSLFLTSTLWYSTPNYAPLLTALNIDQSQTTTAQYKLDDIVTPREFVAYKDGQAGVAVYSNHPLFNATFERIKNTVVSNIQLLEFGLADIHEYQPMLTMSFYNKMPLEYISLILRISNNELSKVESTIQNISLFYDTEVEQVRWLLEGDQLYTADAGITRERMLEIASIINEAAVGVNTQVTEFKKHTIRVTELSNSLFADPTAIRQILEKDQSVIYTDGSRGLRVNSRLQTIDYTDPTVEFRHRDVEFSIMIQEAIKFLNRHQSWVGDYVLAQISKVSGDENEYTLVFQQQYQGYSIIPASGLNISEITLKMKNNRVIRMNRSTAYLGEELEYNRVNILTLVEIKELIARRIDISDRSYDIYLGYYPFAIDESNIQLRPVWVLSRGNVTRNVYDAESGQEIRI